MPRKPPFKHHRFPRDIILCAVRWYLRYPLSYQDVVDLLAEREITVDRSTVYRWVQKFGPELTKRTEKGSVANFITGRSYPSIGHTYAAARLSSMIATASAMTQAPTPKARSIMRFSPMGSRVKLNMRPWPFRSARITSKPLIVA